MKIWIFSTISTISTISIVGFVFGVNLAKVGGFSTNSGAPQKIEKYWQDTGLSTADVLQLVSNDKCYSSTKYFSACLNSLIENSLNYGLKLSTESGALVKLNKNERLDEKNEKELLHLYLKFYSCKKNKNIDFNKIIIQLDSLEIKIKKSFLAAQMINSFLSVNNDPHTYILPGNYYEDVGSKLARSKFFIGISYEKNNGHFYVKKVYKNSDADISGIKFNDRVLAINSVSLQEMSYAEMSQILRNENIKTLNFQVERKNKTLNFVVKRSYRQMSHVQHNTLTDNKYSLITLSKFNPGVCSKITELLNNINKNKSQGLVLDLRDNPGGQLNEAACIAGLFLGKDKKAYYIEYFDQTKSNEVVLTSETQVYAGPLVVLVNASSASASELLAGGLQEYGRALIVGERTFGKGTFQESEDWFFNSKISLFKTQGLYLLPSRKTTQLEGIKPDVVLSDDGITKTGESIIYFNPVVVAANKYPKQNPYEERGLKNISDVCQKGSFFTSDDLYLQKSIAYLSCVNRIASSSGRYAGKATAIVF